MADDKKNISDARKVDEPPEPGKVESAKAAPPVQDQPASVGKEASKDKDAPAPSKEGSQPGKDEKQTTIPGMGDPAPTGKVVDFYRCPGRSDERQSPGKGYGPGQGQAGG